MDGDRKYRQAGYQDSDRPSNGERKEGQQAAAASRTSHDAGSCRTASSASRTICNGIALLQLLGRATRRHGLQRPLPEMRAALHCCKQCTFFEPSTRFQCTKPIPARIPYKDQSNECELFNPRVTVSRDGASGSGSIPLAGAEDSGADRHSHSE